ncbi:MAG: PQQ-binding-like beta-propeller repeat protein [Deltaproteobacteria bacterium]|nr:PQQ-binding-like beta-propeller repeat protein [Deltaproteobacteria bacterium]MBP7292141.1 PQQ-binding-like beta-propeller repeat protein [Nannocystaceae bacterium]
MVPARRPALLPALALALAACDPHQAPDAAGDGGSGGSDPAADADAGGTDPSGGGPTGDDGDSGDGPSVEVGDPSLNRFVLTSADETIVRIEADGSGHTELFAFNEYDDVSSLSWVDGTIYAGGGDNSVNAIDGTTGAFLWDLPMGRYESTSLAEPVMLVDGELAYALGLPGVLTSFRLADRHIDWEYPLDPSGETEGYYSSWGTPLVTADLIFVGTGSSLDTNYLHAIDRVTGSRRWRLQLAHPDDDVPMGVTGGLRRIGDTLLVPAGDLLALDATTGSLRWSYATERLSRGAGTPVVVDDRIYVQNAHDVADGRLDCLALATGELLWSIAAGNDYAGVYTPSVVDGRVYGVDERGGSEWSFGNGRPFAADALSGALLWANDRVSVESSPVLANGRLFFHGQDFDGSGDIDLDVGTFALDAADGSLVWLDNVTRYASATTPLVVADNGVFRAGAAVP